MKRFNEIKLGLEGQTTRFKPSLNAAAAPGCPEGLVPSAVSMRLERLDPLCIPFTIPEGGRSMAAGRAEGVEVVAVTSGGTEKLSKKRRKLLNTPFIIPNRQSVSQLLPTILRIGWVGCMGTLINAKHTDS